MNEKFRAFLFRYGIYLSLGIVLLLHLPFLLADPDLHLSHSRDAHSDEGLNTSQIRNFVNYGYLNAWECDNLVKNPFFNLLIAGPFFLLGTKLWVGRTTILLFSLLTLFFLSRERLLRGLWLVFIPVAGLQFHIFSYTHFSMAEMAAVSCILASICHCVRFIQLPEKRKRRKHLFLALLFSSLAWYFKIQFVYIAVLVPVIFFVWWLRKAFVTRTINREGWLLLAQCAGLTLFFAAGWYFAWYLPLKDAYTYIMHNQASNRFAMWKDIRPIVRENFLRYFTTPQVRPLFFAFLLSLIAAPFLYFRAGKLFRILLPVSFFWALLESHKLLIHFVPARYLVSSYVAMALLVAAVIYELLRRGASENKKRYMSYTGFIAFLLLTSTYAISYYGLFQRRTFQVHAVNRYLAAYDLSNATAVGPWAPSLTWDTKIKALPVWSGFLNDKNIKEQFHPLIVFSEPGEYDSEQAFSKDGFDLEAASDSVKTYKIGKWPVNLYWMKK